MTAITSAMLPLATGLLPVAPTTAVPAATNLNAVPATVDSPASVVSLGTATMEAVDVYDVYTVRGTLAEAPPALIWETTSQDKVTKTMAANLASQDTGARFKGLGAALLTQLSNSGSSYSQSVIQPKGTTAPSAAAVSALQSGVHKTNDNVVSLTMKTASGATVTLSLTSNTDGLATQVDVTGGELSDSELAAVGKLAEGFQSAVDGLTAMPPKLNLDGLTGFDKSVLSSVDLTAKFRYGDIQSFSYSADASGRTVSLSGVDGDLKLSVDTLNSAILGSAAQQAKALQTYLDKFDAARVRGEGNEQLMDMFKSAFTALNSNVGSATAASPGPVLSKTDRALLTGLADFSASISQQAQAINPMRQNEVDTFAYTVSQSTQAKGAQANRSIDQQQQSTLNASYHKGLYPGVALALGMDKTTQNYTYYKIEDSASSASSIAYSKGEILKASLSQSSSQSSTALRYVLGELQSSTITPKQFSESSSVKGLLDAALKQDKDAGFGRNGPAYQRTLDNLQARVLSALDVAK